MRNISAKLMIVLLISSVSIFGQTTLHGIVTDSLSQEALIGASVVIVGTSQGAATNLAGEYQIPNITEGIHKIRVSYVGYRTKIIDFSFKGADRCSYSFNYRPKGLKAGL